MKAKLAIPLIIAFCFGLAGQALAERLILNYCPTNEMLMVEYLGPKIHSWGPNDVECIQWDRIYGVNPSDYGVFCPQIYLMVYDRENPIRVEDAFQLPLGKEIYFRARAYEVGCKVNFTLSADVWVVDQVQRKWWAIGPGEPIPSTLILQNVKAVEDGQGGWVFQTTCCCP